MSDPPAKNPVVRSKSYNIPMLTPVVESDPEAGGLCGGASLGIRRHSIGEMTSCLEEPAFSEIGPSSQGSESGTHLCPDTPPSGGPPQRRGGGGGGGVEGGESPSPSLLPSPSPHLSGSGSGSGSFRLSGAVQQSPGGTKATPPSLTSVSSSPETVVDHILESLDSDPEGEGIFIDFPRRCSASSSSLGHEGGRQSVV